MSKCADSYTRISDLRLWLLPQTWRFLDAKKIVLSHNGYMENKKIKMFSRSSNTYLYSMMLFFAKTLDVPKVPVPFRTEDEYLLEILKEDCDFIINIDDDAFLIEPQMVMTIIQDMLDGGYDYCGIPDGGAISIRHHNPCAMNPFFNIFHVKSIQKKLGGQFTLEWNEKLKEKVPIKGLNLEWIEYDQFESYYPIFYALLDKCNPLYIEAKQSQDDGFSTVLLYDQTPFLVHTWYGREYHFVEQKERIDQIIELVREHHIAQRYCR